MQEDHTTKQMLEQFVDLAGKKVHVEKRALVGAQLEAFAAAVRQDDVHLLAVAVSPPLAPPCCAHILISEFFKLAHLQSDMQVTCLLNHLLAVTCHAMDALSICLVLRRA